MRLEFGWLGSVSFSHAFCYPTIAVHFALANFCYCYCCYWSGFLIRIISEPPSFHTVIFKSAFHFFVFCLLLCYSFFASYSALYNLYLLHLLFHPSFCITLTVSIWTKSTNKKRHTAHSKEAESMLTLRFILLNGLTLTLRYI